jgi:hypothetical protein
MQFRTVLLFWGESSMGWDGLLMEKDLFSLHSERAFTLSLPTLFPVV